ncbi:unnamed protein product [Symbiodinium microadriaticum]|nr:unnamed protein product [Symbiodinium microadriaticum]
MADLQHRNTHKRQREGGEQGDLLMPAFMHGPASGFDMLARIRALCDFFAETPLGWHISSPSTTHLARCAPARSLVRPVAAANHRNLPAHVSEDLVQIGHLSGDTTTTRRRHCAATASSPDHRATHAAGVPLCDWVGEMRAPPRSHAQWTETPRLKQGTVKELRGHGESGFCRQLGLGAVSWETMAHATGEGPAASTISMRQESDAGTAMASMVMSVSEHCGLPARRAAQARSVQNSSSARDAALYVGFPKRNMNASICLAKSCNNGEDMDIGRVLFLPIEHSQSGSS